MTVDLIGKDSNSADWTQKRPSNTLNQIGELDRSPCNCNGISLYVLFPKVSHLYPCESLTGMIRIVGLLGLVAWPSG